jgi:O-antigen/teichoic acid export membrane protein
MTTEPPPQPASPHTRIGVGAAVQLVGSVGQQVFRFFTNWLIARLLGSGILGLYSLAYTLWSAVQMSYGGGLMRALLRYLPHHLARGETAEARGAIRVTMAAAWLGGGLLGLLFYWGADWLAGQALGQPAAAAPLRVFALIMPLAAVSAVLWAVARSLGSLTFITYQFLIGPGLFAALVIPVGLYQGDATGLTWALAGSYLLPLAPLWVHHHHLTRFMRAVAPRALIGPVLSFAGLGALLWLVEFASRNLDLVIVGRLLDSAQAGIYNIASRNATLSHMVLVAFNTFFSPTVSALTSTHRLPALQNIFRRASLWILIVGAPLVALTVALAEPLMRLFGADFTAGASPLVILSLGQLFNIGTGLVATALLMAGWQTVVLVCHIGSLVVTATLCLVLVPLWGLNGAAAAMSLSVVLLNLTLSVWGYRRLGLSPLSAAYPKPLVASAVAGGG